MFNFCEETSCWRGSVREVILNSKPPFCFRCGNVGHSNFSTKLMNPVVIDKFRENGSESAVNARCCYTADGTTDRIFYSRSWPIDTRLYESWCAIPNRPKYWCKMFLYLDILEKVRRYSAVNHWYVESGLWIHIRSYLTKPESGCSWSYWFAVVCSGYLHRWVNFIVYEHIFIIIIRYMHQEIDNKTSSSEFFWRLRKLRYRRLITL